MLVEDDRIIKQDNLTLYQSCQNG